MVKLLTTVSFLLHITMGLAYTIAQVFPQRWLFPGASGGNSLHRIPFLGLPDAKDES